jgi:hypothetical protein
MSDPIKESLQRLIDREQHVQMLIRMVEIAMPLLNGVDKALKELATIRCEECVVGIVHNAPALVRSCELCARKRADFLTADFSELAKHNAALQAFVEKEGLDDDGSKQVEQTTTPS